MRQCIKLLEKNISKYCPESRTSKLKDVCRTRWIERITGIDTFQELFIAIHFTSQDMVSNLERDTQDKALNYLKLISKFFFICGILSSVKVYF